MIRILALIEGQTEESVAKKVLAPDLLEYGKDLRPILLGKPGHKGGIRRYASVRAEILTMLRSDPSAFVTTMFDFYGLPVDFPGRVEALRHQEPSGKATAVEEAILQDITAQMGASWDCGRLIPYVQMFELEALLFSAPEAFARGIGHPHLAAELQKIQAGHMSPEHIDDGPETAPSKRILRLVSAYSKPLHGALGAEAVGLARMLAECRHFAHWMRCLRDLGS